MNILQYYENAKDLDLPRYVIVWQITKEDLYLSVY